MSSGTEPILGEPRLAFRLARRLARSRALIRSTSMVFVAAFFVMTMFIVLKTLSLSGTQVADRDMGRFDASVGYGSIRIPPGDDAFTSALRERMQGAGVTDAQVMLSVFDLQLNTTPARKVTMLEGDWTSSPYPKRYELQSGRWPSRPGEVVVTEADDVRTAPGEALTVLGDVRLTVVGTADDRYADTSNLLVASRTWATLAGDLNERHPLLGAQPFLLWSGAEPKAAVDAFTTAIRDWEKEKGNTVEAGSAAAADTLSLRTELGAEGMWIDKTPAGYTVPALLVPIGAVMLMFGLNDRRFRRTVGTLTALGVPRRTAAAGITLAALLWSLIAAAAGALAGWGGGAAARLLIAHLRERPAGPVEGLTDPVLRLLVLIVLASVGAGLTLTRTRRHPVTRRHERAERDSATAPATKTARRLRDGRQLLALAAWCAIGVYAARVESPAMAMMLVGVVTVAVLLVIPEAFALLLRLLPERGPRLRLARRQLAADSRRACAALAVLTVLFGTSLGFLALLDTLLRTADAQNHPDVQPGQVLLAGSSSDRDAPSEDVVRAAESSGVLEGLPRFEVAPVDTIDEDKTTTRSATRPGKHTIFLAVDSPANAELLLGRPLDRAQASTLTGGGLLIWADAPDAPTGTAARTELLIQENGEILGRTSALPATTVEAAPSGWRAGTDGIMLRSTALTQRLPLQEPGPVMVTGISDKEAETVQQAVIDAGLDARAVRIHVPPQPAVPPAALLATAAALVLLVLVTVLTAVRGQTHALRGYLASLSALGLPHAWARHILLCQHGALIAASTFLGLVIALIPTVVIANRISGFVLSVPWGQLAILLAAIYLAAALAATRSVLRLRVVGK
ncbi:putative ABC transporter integral membrane protein [Streptomyces sp. L-9-10]|uniref:hypothetical protein n=1 Tax=Streptomyces sp. L-9-10 TaxID=1478131 RepID=UPI00101C2439|nr:hypothetical protein [Streptomyces sp. L-9-10]RYJ20637.1 putative ABC transporter integral membrane protein [Streptomyces sp. L-9-10]